MLPRLFALLFSMIATANAQIPLKTVGDRVAEFGDVVRARLEPHFRAAGVSYPPERVTLLGFKKERVLEVYAASKETPFRFIRSYPILAASGLPGPKLREGDRQVPEGIYRVRELNPNSRFHLSLWLDYPNGHDRLRAATEQRGNLGGEIMIHGNAVSRGCLAMGDAAAEDLFVLAALIGIQNVQVILSPIDFRSSTFVSLPGDSPAWTADLYEQIKRALKPYTRPVIEQML